MSSTVNKIAQFPLFLIHLKIVKISFIYFFTPVSHLGPVKQNI